MSIVSNHFPEIIDEANGRNEGEEALAGAPASWSQPPTDEEVTAMGEAAGRLLAKPVRKPRKRRAKPVRTVRLTNPATAENPFSIITIVAGAKSDDYIVRPMASDFGVAFQVEKVADPEQKVYQVNLDRQGGICNCKGHLKWGHCRHVESLTALRPHGRL